MSSSLDTPQLSTKACAGSYSHPSSSIVPETPDASISYSQQIIPAPPSSSAPRILSSNTGASLIRGTPAAIGLFRAPKSLIMLPLHTTPFPYRNYALSFTVRSPMHAQNVPVQAENVSTEDEGGQVGEEEEEEECAERDEVKLVLEVARAQRKICRVEQQLSTARLKEIDALGNLYRFRAELTERKLQYADFDLGHVRHSIQKNGVSLCDLPSTCKRRRMSDNGVTVPRIFVFVVDTCLDEEDLKVLHKATPASPSYIPPCALVGLITLGTTTQVHELSYVERNMLGLSTLARAAPHPGLLMPQQALGAARFLLPMQWVEFQLTRVLVFLQCDP
ncbi:hypothetical protein BKA83DRAFT_18018 [Pisolithus microcarpus]|nr:hypothetical protein BKA83DRAFT_18018 [Pisolithus microcarpus]